MTTENKRFPKLVQAVKDIFEKQPYSPSAYDGSYPYPSFPWEAACHELLILLEKRDNDRPTR